MKALSLCALVGSPNVLLKPGAVQKPCAFCGRALWVSPTTLAMGDNITLSCNECGRKEITKQAVVDKRPIELRYAGLQDGTPDDERRKRELEARGFKPATADEIEDIRKG